MLDYISPISNGIEEFLDRPTFINQYTKLAFCSNNSFSLITQPMTIETDLPLYRALKVSTTWSDLNDLLTETARSF